jgi:hypothetical protein
MEIRVRKIPGVCGKDVPFCGNSGGIEMHVDTRMALFCAACIGLIAPQSIAAPLLGHVARSRLRRIFGTAIAALMLLFSSPSAYALDFSACSHFFANGKPPVVSPRPTHRALCYDAFAVLHSGESKTAVFVAEKLNRASIADADGEKRMRFGW